MKTLILIILLCSLIPGCSGNKENNKIKMDYEAYSHVYQDGLHAISFIQGNLPCKTYLEILDPSTKKRNKLNFTNQGLYGPHELIPSSNQAICSSKHVHNNTLKPKILIVDISKNNTILKEFLLPENNRTTFIKKPAWTHDVFVLLKTINDYNEDQYKIIFKKIDLEKQLLSNTIYEFNLKLNNALFINDYPILILDAVSSSGEYSLIFYDLENNKKLKEIETEAPCIELKQDINSKKIYALVQSLSDNLGKVFEIDIKELDKKLITEISGQVETMQLIGPTLLVTSKDLTRSQEQEKHWLHARNLFFVNPDAGKIEDIINWSQRCGKFIGYDPTINKIYYVIADNDAPGLWTINNTYENLKSIQNVIK
jgi:hypothetical protein